MRITHKTVKKLLTKYKEIVLLSRIEAVLGWDLNVNLPPKASQGRAEQISYLSGLVTDLWLDKEFRKLLDSLRKDKKNLNLKEKAILRNLEQVGKFYFRVPKEIIVEFSETASKAFVAWREAREENKFENFLPFLKKIISLNQIIAKHIGYKDNPYDALLDMYEPGLTSAFCKRIFSRLQPELTDLTKKIKRSPLYKEKNNLTNTNFSYSESDQKQIALFALRKIGYDFNAGRMDISPHPFTNQLGRYDVRVTNRYKSNDFVESLMVALHEGGHALYEQGVNEEFQSTPLGGGVSLGIHESQSRFWENQVGRSSEFVKFITPVLVAFYPNQLSDVGHETLFKLFNRVEPGNIRVESDEVSYNLHISLRFEIEDALINDKIKPQNLPDIWRSKMKKYLGIAPETDSEGVLQDVHWSHGSFGYFPTYTLGNLYAAQFTDKLKKELNYNDIIEKGELGTILSWLRSNIHQYGSLYWPEELSKRISGKKLDPSYFIRYLKQKYSDIYKIK
jgi:carboxypeptidase Taq